MIDVTTNPKTMSVLIICIIRWGRIRESGCKLALLSISNGLRVETQIELTHFAVATTTPYMFFQGAERPS